MKMEKGKGDFRPSKIKCDSFGNTGQEIMAEEKICISSLVPTLAGNSIQLQIEASINPCFLLFFFKGSFEKDD